MTTPSTGPAPWSDKDVEYSIATATSRIKPPQLEPPRIFFGKSHGRNPGVYGRDGRDRRDSRDGDGRDGGRRDGWRRNEGNERGSSGPRHDQQREDRYNPYSRPSNNSSRDDAPHRSHPQQQQQQAALPKPPKKSADHTQRFEWIDGASGPLNTDDLIILTDKTQMTNYDLYNVADIVKRLNAQKVTTSNLHQAKYAHARNKMNPYELVGRTNLFVNRSAIKLAAIDTLFGSPHLFDTSKASFRFLDICAGPGGFIEYLLWRAASSGWDASRIRGWGMTLRGEQDFDFTKFNSSSREMVDAGCFTALYGADGTGDVSNVENLRALRNEIGDDGVDVVLADGGFSCAGDELHQEEQSKHILVGQALGGLMTLKLGGSMVIKVFDLNTAFSVSVLHILHHQFKRIAIVKPHASRPANNERYVLFNNLRHRVPDTVITHLESVLKKLSSLRSPTDAATVSSHHVPPSGFMPWAERVQLGLMDVISVVDREVIAKNVSLLSALRGSNMKHALRQTEALMAIEKMAADDNAESPYDQEDIRIRCLREWNLPH